MKVIFSASGYGTKTYNFKNREELMQDVNGTAAEIEGTVQDNNGNEIIVVDRGGDEAARWEIV